MTESVRRVRPPKKLEKTVVEPLLQGKYFSLKYEVMTFAAALGYRAGESDKIEAYGEGIRYSYFRSDHQHDLAFDVIGVDKAEELGAIASERINERIEAFEGYAAAGLRMIRDACFSGDQSAFKGLVQLVADYGLVDEEEGDELPGLDDLVNAF